MSVPSLLWYGLIFVSLATLQRSYLLSYASKNLQKGSRLVIYWGVVCDPISDTSRISHDIYLTFSSSSPLLYCPSLSLSISFLSYSPNCPSTSRVTLIASVSLCTCAFIVFHASWPCVSYNMINVWFDLLLDLIMYGSTEEIFDAHLAARFNYRYPYHVCIRHLSVQEPCTSVMLSHGSYSIPICSPFMRPRLSDVYLHWGFVYAWLFPLGALLKGPGVQVRMKGPRVKVCVVGYSGVYHS